MQQNIDVANKSGMDLPMDLIVCPKCKGVLEAREIQEQLYLSCAACNLAYPVKDGIPLMLQDEAVTL